MTLASVMTAAIEKVSGNDKQREQLLDQLRLHRERSAQTSAELDQELSEARQAYAEWLHPKRRLEAAERRASDHSFSSDSTENSLIGKLRQAAPKRLLGAIAQIGHEEKRLMAIQPDPVLETQFGATKRARLVDDGYQKRTEQLAKLRQCRQSLEALIYQPGDLDAAILQARELIANADD